MEFDETMLYIEEHLYITFNVHFQCIWIKKINVRHFVVCLFISQRRKKARKKVNRLKILKLFFAVIK